MPRLRLVEGPNSKPSRRNAETSPIMKPTLEPAGPLLIPVDESGTAVGGPASVAPYEPACPYCGRPFETINAVPIRHPQRYADALQILARLAHEARMFRDHGHGREHLTNALIDAQRVLGGGAL